MFRLSQAQRDHRQTLKEGLDNVRDLVSAVRALDEFLQGTRPNDYLYFKRDANGRPVASSQCRTIKDSTHSFELKVPEQGRREFLVATYVRMWQLKDHADPLVRQKVQAVANLCLDVCVGPWMGLQNTSQLRGAVATLREALDEAQTRRSAETLVEVTLRPH